MTRQRAQALATPSGASKRKNTRSDKEKPVRGIRAKRALAEAEAEAAVAAAAKESKEDSGAEDAKQRRSRVQLIKKMKTAKEEQQSSPQKSGTLEMSTVESRLESSIRLPIKKRLTIRNEIEEFVTQRRTVSFFGSL